jgi:uncharacterized membrane protein
MKAINANFKTEFFPALLTLLAIGLSFYFYANFPPLIASHWNIAGEVDGWMSRGLGAFLFPGLILVFYLLLLFLPSLDPKKKQYQDFPKVYHIVKNMIVAFMFILYILTSFYNLGFNINITIATTSLVGILLFIMGLYMNKIKSNWFLGIRTPWTMSSDKVWEKTHKLGGWMFCIFGLLIMACGFAPVSWRAWLFIIGIILAIFPVYIYSYLVYRKEKK